MSLQIASINIILAFSAKKKKIGDFKVMEGVPKSLQSVLFTLINPLFHLTIFHGVTGTAWLLLSNM